MESPIDDLLANLGLGIVSPFFTSLLATKLPVLASANTKPSNLQNGYFPYNHDNAGPDVSPKSGELVHDK